MIAPLARSARRWVGAGAAGMLALLIFGVAAAADFTVPPRPHTEVVDAAGALSEGTRNALETELQSFEASSGHHVVVYIGQTTGSVPLETWTAQTAQAWKVGAKGKDDGAILFVFMRDHKVRIEVGYGLEGTLTDASASAIIRDTIVPKMKSGDTDAAVTDGVTAMLTAIDPAYKSAQLPSDGDGKLATASPTNPLVFLGVVLFVVLLAFFIVMQIYTAFWYGHLIRAEGKEQATKDIRKSWLRFFLGTGGGAVIGSSYSGGGGFSGGGGGGGGFSGGSFGGGFGGGGASGGW